VLPSGAINTYEPPIFSGGVAWTPLIVARKRRAVGESAWKTYGNPSGDNGYGVSDAILCARCTRGQAWERDSRCGDQRHRDANTNVTWSVDPVPGRFAGRRARTATRLLVNGDSIAWSRSAIRRSSWGELGADWTECTGLFTQQGQGSANICAGAKKGRVSAPGAMSRGDIVSAQIHNVLNVQPHG